VNVAHLTEANRLRLLAVEAGDCPILHAIADREMDRLIEAHRADRLSRREQSRAADRQAAGESRNLLRDVEEFAADVDALHAKVVGGQP